MKTLSKSEIMHVSGGDFTMTIDGFVPSDAGPYVTTLFQQLVNGQLPTTSAFVTALQDPQVSAAFDKVRITDIKMSNFN